MIATILISSDLRYNFFMGLQNWGGLQKSATDDETIEEAINRLIAVHLADESAHLGASESLQTHKSASVIDHPADSVVTDKVPDYSVLKEKLTTNKDFVSCNFESIDFWSHYGTGSVNSNFGAVSIMTTSTANNLNEFQANGDPFFIDFYAKNPVFEEIVRLYDTTSQIAYFGIGQQPSYSNAYFVGFKVSNGTLYACWKKNGSEYTTQIDGITLTNFHTYRAVMTSGVDIKFYIDDVHVATATTNLPDAEEILSLWVFSIKNTTTSERLIVIKNCIFFQDK